MIPRRIAPVIERAADVLPVVTLPGPRQSVKTTLVKALFGDHAYFKLENPETRAIAARDPKSLLERGSIPLVIDEVQRLPDILSWSWWRR